jgi:ribose-phosphate pyrophosphokinase
MKNMKLFALESAIELGKKISKKINVPLTEVVKTEFLDGERLLVSQETVRNKDVFIVASMGHPVNDNFMDICLFLDSLKRASAKGITLVLTYYGYARQDRKAKGRQPIGAKLVADFLQKAGATKIIAVDLHNSSIQGFFDIPVDDLRGQFVLADKIIKTGKKFTVASPDHGGAVRARILAELISDTIEIAIVDKRRTGPNEAEVMNVLGNVKNKNIVLVDDMIDSGGTIIKATKALKLAGAKQIIVAATHGLFNKGFEMFEECKDIDKVIITDSIGKVYDFKKFKKLEIVSLDDFLGNIILAVNEEKSISAVYENVKTNINKK